MCGTKTLPFSPLQHTSLTKSRTEPFGSDWSWSEHVFLFFSFPLLHPLENVDISAKGWKPKPWIFSIGKRWGKGRGIIPKLPTIKSLLLLRLLGFWKGSIFGGQGTLFMKISVLSKPNFSLEVFQLAPFSLVMVWTLSTSNFGKDLKKIYFILLEYEIQMTLPRHNWYWEFVFSVSWDYTLIFFLFKECCSHEHLKQVWNLVSGTTLPELQLTCLRPQSTFLKRTYLSQGHIKGCKGSNMHERCVTCNYPLSNW